MPGFPSYASFEILSIEAWLYWPESLGDLCFSPVNDSRKRGPVDDLWGEAPKQLDDNPELLQYWTEMFRCFWMFLAWFNHHFISRKRPGQHLRKSLRRLPSEYPDSLSNQSLRSFDQNFPKPSRREGQQDLQTSDYTASTNLASLYTS